MSEYASLLKRDSRSCSPVFGVSPVRLFDSNPQPQPQPQPQRQLEHQVQHSQVQQQPQPPLQQPLLSSLQPQSQLQEPSRAQVDGDSLSFDAIIKKIDGEQSHSTVKQQVVKRAIQREQPDDDEDGRPPAKRTRQHVLIPEWAVFKPQAKSNAFFSFLRTALSLFFVPSNAITALSSNQKIKAAIKNGDNSNDQQKQKVLDSGRIYLNRFGQSAAVGIWGDNGKVLRDAFLRWWKEQHSMCSSVASSMAQTIPHALQDRTLDQYISANDLVSQSTPVLSGVDCRSHGRRIGILPNLELGFMFSGSHVWLYQFKNDLGAADFDVKDNVRAIADVSVPTTLLKQYTDLKITKEGHSLPFLLVATEHYLYAYRVEVQNHLISVTQPKGWSQAFCGISDIVSTQSGSVFIGCAFGSSVFEAKVTHDGILWIREAVVERKTSFLGYLSNSFSSMFTAVNGCRKLYVDDSRNRLYVLAEDDTITVYDFKSHSSSEGGAVLTPNTVLSNFVGLVRSAFDDSQPRCKEIVPQNIDVLFDDFKKSNRERGVGRNSHWGLVAAARSRENKWKYINHDPRYCPPLVASVIVLPVSECPFATVAVVLNSGHRIYFNSSYTMEQVRAAPPCFRQGIDVVVDACGMKGYVIMQHECIEEKKQGCLLLSRTYRGQQFVEKCCSLLSMDSQWSEDRCIACATPPSQLGKYSDDPSVTKPSAVLSCELADPLLSFIVLSSNSVNKLRAKRPVELLSKAGDLTTGDERINDLIVRYPPTIAAAIIFEAFLEVNSKAGRRMDSIRDFIKSYAKSSPVLQRSSEFCNHFGSRKSYVDGQCLALDRMLSPLLSMRCFTGFFDEYNSNSVILPVPTRDDLRRLVGFLANVKQSVYDYNDIYTNIDQEKLLRKQVGYLRSQAEMKIMKGSSSVLGTDPLFSSMEEQNVMHFYALLCDRLKQVLFLLEMFVVEGDDDDCWKALCLLDDNDLQWLRTCTLGDLALNERGNAAIGRIINAVIEFKLINQSLTASDYDRLAQNLSLFFTDDSRRLFSVKQLIKQLLDLQQSERSSLDVQRNMDTIRDTLSSCKPLDFDDMKIVFTVFCSFQCFAQAIRVVMDNFRRMNDAYSVVQFEGREQFYQLVLQLLEEQSKGVRSNTALAANNVVKLTEAEEVFCELLDLSTGDGSDSQWLERLLNWISTKGFTHLFSRIHSPYVVEFLEKHPQRDILLPRYYYSLPDGQFNSPDNQFNCARAFFQAATTPTMPCTLEQREGNLLIAQRIIKECSMLDQSVASLSMDIDTALTNLRFQQKVRAGANELCLTIPDPAEKRVLTAQINNELTSDIYSIKTLVDSYVRPLGLTELELLSLQYQQSQQEVIEQSRLLWRRLLRERLDEGKTLATGKFSFIYMHAHLPQCLFPLDEIVPTLEGQHAIECSEKIADLHDVGLAVTLSALDGLVTPVHILLNAKVKHSDLFFEYARMCSEIEGIVTSEAALMAQIASMYSLLYVVQDWLRSVDDAFSAPAFAEDIAHAISILQLTNERVTSTIRKCSRVSEEQSVNHSSLSTLYTEFAKRCQLVLKKIAELCSTESYRIAVRYQHVPQTSWLSLNNQPFSTQSALP